MAKERYIPSLKDCPYQPVQQISYKDRTENLSALGPAAGSFWGLGECSFSGLVDLESRGQIVEKYAVGEKLQVSNSSFSRN